MPVLVGTNHTAVASLVVPFLSRHIECPREQSGTTLDQSQLAQGPQTAILGGTIVPENQIQDHQDNSAQPSSNLPVLASPPSLPNELPDIDFAKIQTDSEDQLQRLKDLVRLHAGCFSKHSGDFGCTSAIQHEIPLKDAKAFRLPHRRIPPAQYQAVRQHLQDMIASGAIRESKSPYASQIVVVPKKDGTLRICIDYRKLNQKTERDSFPLPRIEEALDALGGAKYFSTLDLTSGYWQVEVKEEDKHKTAFATPMGLFECNRMPFGLQNAPATFQRLMNRILGDQQFETLLLYLDDIIVYSSTFEEHLERLQLVFRRLQQHGLKLKPSKCHFLQHEVTYLGHKVSAKGVVTDPEKITKVKDWPRPSNPREVLQFLGFAGYYRRFIPKYATIASPLYELTTGIPKKTKKKKQRQEGRKRCIKSPPKKFSWTSDSESAFQTLKDKLTSAPVMGYPDFSLPFILQIDASGDGLGAVLAQVQDGQERVITYASRAVRPSESRYPAHKLEFLGLKWAVTEKFHDYLYGRQFSAYTDNNPLVYVMTTAKLDAHGQRWVGELANYDFSITYRPGRSNANADGLSRLPTTLRHISADTAAALLNEAMQRSTSAVAGNTARSVHWADPLEIVHYCDRRDPSSTAEERENQPAYTNSIIVASGSRTLPPMTGVEIQQHQQNDVHLARVISYLEAGEKPSKEQRQAESHAVHIILKQWDRLSMGSGALVRHIKRNDGSRIDQLVLPASLRPAALKGLHDDVGHLGLERTLELARQRFYWPKMAEDIQLYITRCVRCCLRKTPTSHIRAPLMSIHTTSKFELVCMDFLTLERSRGGYEHILVVTDHFSRFSKAFPTKDQKATTVAKLLWHQFFLDYDMPQRLHSDQGRNFESAIIKELCRLSGVSRSRTTSYHPQGNGVTERLNRTLLQMLGTMESKKKEKWADHIDEVVRAYNVTKHESTGFSPHFLMFAQHPRLPVDLIFGHDHQDVDKNEEENGPTRYSDIVEDMKERLSHALSIADKHAQASKQRQQKTYNKRLTDAPFCPGDRVLVRKTGIVGRNKIGDRWEPVPYVVKERRKDSPVYIVEQEGSTRTRTVHRNMLTQCMFLPLDNEVHEVDDGQKSEVDTIDTESVDESPTEAAEGQVTEQIDSSQDEPRVEDLGDGHNGETFVAIEDDVRVPKDVAEEVEDNIHSRPNLADNGNGHRYPRRERHSPLFHGIYAGQQVPVDMVDEDEIVLWERWPKSGVT